MVQSCLCAFMAINTNIWLKANKFDEHIAETGKTSEQET